MSVKLSERTKRMRKNFMKERREGKTIAQIAKEYEMNVSTVYSSLQIIADENNVSRESLLEKDNLTIPCEIEKDIMYYSDTRMKLYKQ